MPWTALRDRLNDRLNKYPMVALAQFYTGRDPRGYLVARTAETEVRVVDPETLEPWTTAPMTPDTVLDLKTLRMYYYRLMGGRTYAIRGLRADKQKWRTVIIRVDGLRRWTLLKTIDEE